MAETEANVPQAEAEPNESVMAEPEAIVPQSEDSVSQSIDNEIDPNDLIMTDIAPFLSDRLDWPNEVREDPMKAHALFSTNDEVENLFNAIDEGERKLKLDVKDDGILYIGNSGSGKSTAAILMVGDTDKLDVILNKQGQKVFNDLYNKTSDSGLVSKTLIPDLWHDKDTKAALYDLPGFDDSRGLQQDITAQYLIQKVVHHTKKLKVVVVANYYHINSLTADRSQFRTLLNYTSAMLNDIPRFGKAISLIATRVPSDTEEDEEGLLRYIPDSVQRNYIAGFFQKFRDELKQTTVNKNDPAMVKFHKDAQSLVDIFLQQDAKGDYPRIGLFHSPTKLGLVTKNTRVMSERGRLRDLVFKRTEYADVGNVQFGLAISPSTRLDIKRLVPQIVKKIEEEMKLIAAKLKEHYQHKVKHATDYILLKQQLQLETKLLTKATDELLLLKDAMDYIKRVVRALADLQVKIPVKHFITIKTQAKYLSFFEKISPSEKSTLQWTAPLKSTLAVVDEYRGWFDFIVQLYNELSAYEIQINRNKYNVKNLNDWGMANREQGIFINAANYKNFFKVLREKQKIFGVPQNTDPVKLDLLHTINEVLNVTLLEENRYTCPDGLSLTATGSFLTVSDVLSRQKICRNGVTAIKLIAYNTIYLDTTVDLVGKQVSLALMAPTLNVNKLSYINLSGKDGAFPNPAFAEEGSHPGATGEHGKAGLPGTPGGNYVAIARTIINPKSLVVKTDGGKGGPGQSGGKGREGTDVEKPLVSDKPKIFKYYKRLSAKESIQRYFNAWMNTYPEYKIDVTSSLPARNWRSCWYEFTLYPWKKAGNGGRGGNGGSGGPGAKAGQALIVTTLELTDDQPEVSSLNGKVGNGGQGGAGGAGGHKGYNLTCFLSIEYYKLNFLPNEYEKVKDEINLRYAESGEKGDPDISTIDYKKALKPRTYIFPYDLNQIKSHLRKRLHDKIQGSNINSFIKEVEANPTVNKEYGILSYIDEFKILEEQYNAMYGSIDFTPHYESLARRVEAYSESLFKEHGEDVTYWFDVRMVLLRIHVACKSKIASLNEMDTTLVINVESFLKSIKSEVKSLRALQKDELKEYETDRYLKVIQEKIKEVEELAAGDLQVSIQASFTNMESSVDKLVKEVVKLQDSTKAEIDQLQKNEEKLARNLIIKRCLGAFSIVGTLVGMLGPKGKIAEAGINAALNIAEHFVKDPKDVEPVKVPAGMDNALKDMEKELDKTIEDKTEVVESQLKKIAKEFEGIGGVFDKIKKDFDDLAKDLEKDKKNKKVKKEKLDKIQKKIDETLDKSEKEEEKKGTLTEKGKKAFEVAKKIGTVVGALHKEYKAFENDAKKVKIVSNQIEKSLDKFRDLIKFEDSIYNSVFPMVKKMRDNVHAIKNGLAKESQASLSVTNWKIHDVLSEMKVNLVRVVKGFEIESDIQQIFQRLERTLTALITLYDHIQNYEGEKRLGKYISEIIGQKSDAARISRTLRQPYLDIMQAIKRNVMVHNFKLALASVKLNVFPLAKIHLANVKLPNNNDPVRLADEISDAVDTFLTTFQRYKDTIVSGKDENIFTQIYDQELTLNEWHATKFGTEINRLLSGKAIMLKSDINQRFNHNAIKISEVALGLKPIKGSKLTQERIEKILKPFQYSLKHSGYSIYRCDNRIYSINHPPQNIEQTFNKRGTVPDGKNDVYEKLKSGDVLISPFTYWTISLSHTANKSSTDFSALKELQGKVHLDVTGLGRYVSPNLKVCDDYLDYYYTQDQTEGDLVQEFKEQSQYEQLLRELELKQFGESKELLPPNYSDPNEYVAELIEQSEIPPVIDEDSDRPPQPQQAPEVPFVPVEQTYNYTSEWDILLDETSRKEILAEFPVLEKFAEAYVELNQLPPFADRKKRWTRVERSVQWNDSAVSSAGKCESSINSLINMVLLQLTVLQLPKIGGMFKSIPSYFSGFFSNGNTATPEYHETESVKVEGFYHNVNNILLLAPVFLHLSGKWSGLQRQVHVSSGVCQRLTAEQLFEIVQSGDRMYEVESDKMCRVDDFVLNGGVPDMVVPSMDAYNMVGNVVQSINASPRQELLL